jgi:predicted Zn-dependent protease
MRSGLVVFALVGGLSARGLADDASSDVVLKALVTELNRSTQAVKGASGAPLYYLSYRVNDGRTVEITASYGALDEGSRDRDNLAGRVRVLDVSARVGSARLDNTHKIRSGQFDFDFGDSVGDLKTLPIEDDEGALRLAIWRATDAAYKSAQKQLIQVRTNSTVKVAEEDDAADFDQEAPHTLIGAQQPLTFDTPAWDERIRKLSAVFKDHPRILRSQVSLEGGAWTKYFVDSDGARIREPQSFFRIMIQASVTADDGMELNLYRDFEAETPEQLPKETELKAAIEEVAAQLEALRTAPAIDPYSGPAIIMNRAAAVFFHEIFGHRVEGHRQKDSDEGHTFTHKVGQSIVPPFISVTDDPTRTRYGTTLLNGHYQYDDEGVPAAPAALVEQGTLKGFLMGRSPIHGFGVSNGHGRAQFGMKPVARQGNLIVSSTKQVPFAMLRQQLIEEVKRRGKPYGLIFEDISGGFTQTRAGSLPQAFKVLPLVVKRVYADGRPDELVRGVDMIGTPLQSFEKIQTTGDDFAVFNGFCGAESGWVPVSAVAPSLLIGEVEVERQRVDQERPPILPPPLHPDVPWTAPQVVTAPTGTAPSATKGTP